MFSYERGIPLAAAGANDSAASVTVGVAPMPREELVRVFLKANCMLVRQLVTTTLLLAAALLPVLGLAEPPYPASSHITGISWDMSTLKTLAPFSDNWCVTWADNDHQYTSWGDGGGFGGGQSDGRASMGVGRVEGSKGSYKCYNVWGGKNGENPAAFAGKCYGLLSIGSTLYMWRSGDGSSSDCFGLQELRKSTDYGASWQRVLHFDDADFTDTRGFLAPTFLQFGKAYAAARDEYVYVYAPENKDGVWEVQKPGHIGLMRVPRDRISEKGAYRCFTGLGPDGNPEWFSDVNARKPVFADSVNGVMRTSVTYVPGLRRYVLMTQQKSRFKRKDGHIGIYDAPEPWGPWTTVFFENAWRAGIQKTDKQSKTVFWNLSSKWMSPDGRRFVMVYTGSGSDEWGTVEGTFLTPSGAEAPVITAPAADRR